MLTLFDKFREYCKSRDILFILGSEEYQNSITAMKGLKPDQLVLMMEGTVSPTFAAAEMTSVTYTLTIILGRKCESRGAKSHMSETFDDKWNNRLRELMELFTTIVSGAVCDFGYEISAMSLTPQVNRLDLNIDCISGQVTLVVEA